VKPYKPAVLDFRKKSDSKLLKKINNITKSSKPSNHEKEPKEDLSDFIRNIVKESTLKKNSKKVDSNKVSI